LRDDLALACDGTDDADLAGADAAGRPARALVAVFVLALPAKERFVHFDDARELAELGAVHRRADAMAHVPDCFVTRLVVEHGALDLQSAHALLRRQHQERDREPGAERILRVLEDRPGEDTEAVAFGRAVLALPVKGAALERVDF